MLYRRRGRGCTMLSMTSGGGQAFPIQPAEFVTHTAISPICINGAESSTRSDATAEIRRILMGMVRSKSQALGLGIDVAHAVAIAIIGLLLGVARWLGANPVVQADRPGKARRVSEYCRSEHCGCR